MKNPQKSSPRGAALVAKRQAEFQAVKEFQEQFARKLERRGVSPRKKETKSFGDYLDEGSGDSVSVVVFGIRKALDKQKDSP